MTDGNVTIDPASKASAAKQLEIKEVRSRKSGRLIQVRDFIERQTYASVVRCRTLIREGIRTKPRHLCSTCGVPVYLIAQPDKSFHFRHTVENGSCPWRTRSPYTRDQIKAMKYLGARESDAHKRIKERLVRSLEADPKFSGVKVETTWRASGDSEAYRRPDVQAQFGDVRIALEAQLSTTFLDVVIDRREFYRNDRAMLLWVLQRYNPDYRRLTEDDITFSNNSNALMVDQETTELSEQRRAFHLRCGYWEPHLEDEMLRYRWAERVCRFDELTLDVTGQRAFLFDVAGHQLELRQQQAAIKAARRKAEENEVRSLFYSFCEGWNTYTDADQVAAMWSALYAAFVRLGVPLPTWPELDGKLRSLILAILSIKLGKPTGFQFRKLVEVLHMIAERHKDLLWHVGWALKIYERADLIRSEDRLNKWARRQVQIRAAMEARAAAYQPYRGWSETLAFLFPEMVDHFPHNFSGSSRMSGADDPAAAIAGTESGPTAPQDIALTARKDQVAEHSR
jgi:hypothetical protein